MCSRSASVIFSAWMTFMRRWLGGRLESRSSIMREKMGILAGWKMSSGTARSIICVSVTFQTAQARGWLTNGRIAVAVDDEAKFAEARAEVARVERQAAETLAALGAVEHLGREVDPAGDEGHLLRVPADAHNACHAGNDLRQHGRAERLAVDVGVVHDANAVDGGAVAGNVATGSTEGLGKGAHQNVNLAGVDAKVIADTAAVWANGTNRVRLVDVEVELEAAPVRLSRHAVTRARTLYLLRKRSSSGRLTRVPSIE